MNPNNNTRPKTLTTMESNQLLDVLLRDTGTFKQKAKGIRNYTIGLIMLDAGLRVGEVTKLRVQDLFFNTQPVTFIFVHAENTKTDQERTVPTSQRLRTALSKLHANILVPEFFTTDGYAFGFRAGRLPITTRQIGRIINAAGHMAFGRDVNPHMLRHTFASKLMRTTNIRIVQELLGHKQLSSTQIYTHPDAEDLKNAIDKMP